MYSLVLILQDLPPLLFKWHLAILYNYRLFIYFPLLPLRLTTDQPMSLLLLRSITSPPAILGGRGVAPDIRVDVI